MPIDFVVDRIILGALSREPLPALHIERRLVRSGLFSSRPVLLTAALERLESAEWIASELVQGEKLYSLTPAGKQQLQTENERQRSVLAEFVEEGRGRRIRKKLPESWN